MHLLYVSDIEPFQISDPWDLEHCQFPDYDPCLADDNLGQSKSLCKYACKCIQQLKREIRGLKQTT